MKYEVKGLSLHVTTTKGEEPTLVFIHYWGGTSRTWGAVIDELRSRFATVAYDIRGWGHSDKRPAGYTVSDLAEEVLGLVERLELQSYVLVGHSFGGKIAQLAASRRPEGLKALVLVAPAPPTPLYLPNDVHEFQLHVYEKRETVLEAIGNLTAHPAGEEIIEQIIEDSMSGSREATLAYPTASIFEDISTEVAKITVATLVLAGEFDKVDSLEQHQREVIGRIPGARLVVVNRSGHLMPIDEPVRLAAEIRNFVGSLKE